jgi:UDP-glucose 4-epimerase
MTKSSKTLIIGGAGFIGSHIVKKCLNKKVNTRVLDRSSQKTKSNLAEFMPSDVLYGDYNDEHVIQTALDGVRTVVFLPNATVPSSGSSDLSTEFSTNIYPLTRLLNKIKSVSGVKKFIYLSSGGTVYGESTTLKPIVESHPKNPVSTYGLGKLESENAITTILSDSDVSSDIFRLSNIYGERQNMSNGQGVVGIFFKALLHNKTIEIFGNGGVVRDYLYVSDVASAVYLSIADNSSGTRTRTYNLGSGVGTSILQLTNLMENASGRKFTIKHTHPRNFDCSYNVLHIKKITTEFGWAPSVKLPDGLKRTWSWFQGI